MFSSEHRVQKIFLEYIHSSVYESDLEATRELWLQPEILGLAGMFIFLSYITIPILTAIHSTQDGTTVRNMRLGLESNQEKHFLENVLGLNGDSGKSSGIKDTNIQKSITSLRERHYGLKNMQPDYMNYISGIIAISPLRACACKHYQVSEHTQTSYWRYISHVALLLGTELANTSQTMSFCESFAATYSCVDNIGASMLSTLMDVHHKYLQSSLAVVFPSTLLTFQGLLHELNA